MIPKLFEIGPFPVHSFGLMMVLCFFSAWRRLELSLEARGYDTEHAEPLIFWGAVGGILGARVLFVLSNLDTFAADPISAIFSSAGFTFYGGFIGGSLATTVYLKRNNLPFFKLLDVIAPCLALGYAVGRIGCQLAGDGDYGKQCSELWCISYEYGAAPSSPGLLMHPTPVYESIASFIIAYILVKLSDGLVNRPGRLFGIYLILMSIERFLVEFIRIEPIVGESLTQAQIIAAWLSLIGLGLVLFARTTQSNKA